VKVRASLGKDTPKATAQLLNSFTVENGPAQRMTYLFEVRRQSRKSRAVSKGWEQTRSCSDGDNKRGVKQLPATPPLEESILEMDFRRHLINVDAYMAS